MKFQEFLIEYELLLTAGDDASLAQAVKLAVEQTASIEAMKTGLRRAYHALDGVYRDSVTCKMIKNVLEQAGETL